MRFYRLLLHLYPSSYRADYGDEMCAILQQELRQCDGWLVRLGLLLTTVVDVLSNAAAVHWEIVKRDVRYSVRSLRRSPGFAITAFLLVTIGIGANAAIFTLADYVLVRPLPFPEPQQLVKVWEKHPGYSRMELSPPNYHDFKAASTSFQDLAAYSDMSVNLVGQGESLRINAGLVTGNLFSVLGKPAWIGRYFNERDDAPGAAGITVLSYTLWQTVFGGNASVLGRAIYLDGAPYTVIGVMPPDFHFPDREIQLWKTFTPEEMNDPDRSNNWLIGIGRLKGAVSLSQVRAELTLIAAQLRQKYPKENEHVDTNVTSLRDDVSNQARLLLITLCGAALCILVITCANLANLVLVRSLARQKELSIRVSIGANRRYILRQLFSESLIVGVAGGAGAIGVALAALPLLSRLVPSGLPVEQVPPLDTRMLLTAVALTVATIIGFGISPALGACRKMGFAALREGVRTGGAGHHRVRSALVVAEVVISVVLLISSGLLIRALWRVQATDPGFRTNGVLTLVTDLPLPKYEKTSVREQFYTRVLTEVRALPGVQSAAYISALPMVWRGGIWPVNVNGRSQDRSEGNSASLRFVTPGFFATLGIPLKQGRDVNEWDTAGRAYVAIVSESFVRRYWPDQQPIGRHFDFGMHDREVIGVVGDIHVRGLEHTSEPQVYLSYKQVPDGAIIGYIPKALAIHTSQAPEQLLPAVRRIITSADPQQPIANMRTMQEIVAGETESRGLQMRVLIIFTVIAMVLAGLGIYGVLSFTVSLRQQEFGIRMALGARQGDISKLVLRQGAVLTLAGLIPGLLVAHMAARLLESMLAGVNPGDAATFSTAAAVCLITALIGAFMPALRAIRIDPSAVMRVE